MCNSLAGIKQSTTSDLVTHLNLSIIETSATAGRSSRAVSNQSITNDTEVKVEVKREAGIDEFEEVDHGEEEQDGRDENNSGGVLEGDKEKRVLHAGV